MEKLHEIDNKGGRNRNMGQGATLKMKRRLNYVIIVAIILAFSILVGSLVNISVVNNEFYTNYAENRQLRPQTIPATRGSIYDRNMTVLAQSATVWDVIISPKDIKSKCKEDLDTLETRRKEIATALATTLSLDYQKIYDMTLKETSQYQVVKKKVEKDVADKIRELVTTNKWASEITLFESNKRFYTNPTRASSVIGFTGADSQGLYGLEYQYDEILRGTPGYIVTLRDGLSQNIPTSYEEKYEPIDGNSLVLTIDETIQRYLNKELTRVMALHTPEMGCMGIVMNVNTGEILAMESLPTFDLNQPYYIYDEKERAAVEAITDPDAQANAKYAAQAKQWANRPVSYDYEPGSTFKVLVSAAATEEKTTLPSTTFFCPGYIKVEDRTMRCHIGMPGHGQLDFTHALVNSCNPAFVNIGFSLGAHQFARYFQSFGLTEKTGIDLPGEGKGAYIDEASLAKSRVSLASSSFGQTTTITAIQLVTALSAAVNGGYLVTPHTVKDILDQNGNVVRSIGTDVKRQVISEETSKVVCEMMKAVVDTKRGSNAYIQGYNIGGKSGTSQKQKKGDSEDDRIASYFAVTPTEKPEIGVYIMVDIPKSGEVYGSVIAAPAAANVLSDTLAYLGYSPSFTAEEIANQNITVPLLVGTSIIQTTSQLSASGFAKPIIIGDGDFVVKQVPENGTKIARDGKIILYTEEGTEEKSVTVPDVVGMQSVSAKKKLESLGLNVVVKGESIEHVKSKITTQSISAETTLPVGSVVTLTSVSAETD